MAKKGSTPSEWRNSISSINNTDKKKRDLCDFFGPDTNVLDTNNSEENNKVNGGDYTDIVEAPNNDDISKSAQKKSEASSIPPRFSIHDAFESENHDQIEMKSLDSPQVAAAIQEVTSGLEESYVIVRSAMDKQVSQQSSLESEYERENFPKGIFDSAAASREKLKHLNSGQHEISQEEIYQKLQVLHDYRQNSPRRYDQQFRAKMQIISRKSAYKDSVPRLHDDAVHSALLKDNSDLIHPPEMSTQIMNELEPRLPEVSIISSYVNIRPDRSSNLSV